MTDEVAQATAELRDFLFENIYTNSLAKADEEKAVDMLIVLYEYFYKHPDQMPALYVRNIERDGVGCCVCDYVSGMTDRYAVDTYRNLFVPSAWKGLPT